MMHDMGKIYWGEETSTQPENLYMRLKFETDPLSCIITLADVLQDFSRPTVSFRENSEAVEVRYLSGCDSTILEIDNSSGVLKIMYRYDDRRQRASKLKWLPAEHREYFDQRYGYLDLSAAGIRRVDMETHLVP